MADLSDHHLHGHMVILTQLDGLDLAICEEISPGFGKKVALAVDVGVTAVAKFAKTADSSWRRAKELVKKYSSATAAADSWDLESIAWMFDEKDNIPETELKELRNLYGFLPDTHTTAEKLTRLIDLKVHWPLVSNSARLQ